MEVYLLDNELKKSAEYLPDKYIVKSSIELKYLLCTVYYNLGINNEYNEICEPVSLNSDYSNWLLESLDNWILVRDYALIIQDEYQYRFGVNKVRFGNTVEGFINPPLNKNGITKMNKGIPGYYSNIDIVDAYRQYFIDYKKHIKQYTRRQVPRWFK